MEGCVMPETFKNLKFDPSFNLGHVFMILGMTFTVGTMWTNLNSQIAQQEVRLNQLEKIVIETQIFHKSLMETMTQLRVDSAIHRSRMERIEQVISPRDK